VSGIINRTCPECGDYFTTNRIDRHYCSDDCRNGQKWPTIPGDANPDDYDADALAKEKRG
jgi:endogenous inhibitor of DNA gyrase (YacG/DUF329 family)